MALPQMDSDPTAFGQVPDAQQVTSTTTVAEARARLRESGENAAVVYGAGRPIGIVTVAALAGAQLAGHADAPVGATLDYVAVPVDPRADSHDTVRTFTEAAWHWLMRRPGIS